jgi:hypothetical protein
MPLARQRSRISPRIIRRCDLANYFSHSETWVTKNLEKFLGMGMPAFNRVLDGWDKAALDRWLDRVSGLVSDGSSPLPNSYDTAWLKASRRDKRQD